ncbi:MAG: F0F1 ATP synthase subunit epsilon [Planctomycetota bacterium]
MASKFTCKLVTPTRQLLDREAVYVCLPAWDGLIGIQPGRAPIVARLGSGELLVRVLDDDGRPTERSFFVASGFAKMAGGELTVLAEDAAPAEELNEVEEQKALSEAEGLPMPEDAKGRDDRRSRIHAAKTRVQLAKGSKAKGI